LNYYNEHDPKAAAWLRELIRGGHIPPGEVDERDIQLVRATELVGFTQCHFFAGIGGWSLALRLAGWPEDRPVWTGSCPCQPFSAAGKQLGTADERHLWPIFGALIRECRPAIVFGEQVASKAALQWLDGVFADLEGADYACGAADLCAAGVGAPHIRQRLWWVANLPVAGSLPGAHTGIHRGEESGRPRNGEPERCGGAGGLAFAGSQSAGRIVCGPGEGAGANAERASDQSGGSSNARGLENADTGRRATRGSEAGSSAPNVFVGQPSKGSAFWSDYELLPCLDGKARRTQPGLFPLAHGIPGRVGLLRGAGNAIVAEVGAEVIGAWLEAKAGLTTNEHE
jgi:DNA (cytosine-5)-methyltransferase 1